jgi:hypothetical protein
VKEEPEVIQAAFGNSVHLEDEEAFNINLGDSEEKKNKI